MNRLKRFKVSEFSAVKAICPNCGTELDGCTNANPDGDNIPKPGDLSICISCGEPCEYGQDKELVKLSPGKMEAIKSDPEIQRMIFMVQSMAKKQKPDTGRKYAEQLEEMAGTVKSWKNEHPNLSPMIQYNFPKEVCVIGSLEDAIKNNFVSINDDARTMFNDLSWLDDKPTMPTVLMVRAVMESVFL